nr:hypothetical protein [Amylibacter sp.]
MRGRYRCLDPLDAATRVMDTARRMNMNFSQLQFERADNASFVLTFALEENNPQKLRNFAHRIGLHLDLTEDCVDV